MSSRTCPGCGARLADGVERCDLCGTPVGDDLDATSPSEEPGHDDIPEPRPGPVSEDSAADGNGVYCNACGWKNPAGANYCARCGSVLQSAGENPAAPAPGTRRVDKEDVAARSEEGPSDAGERDDGSMARHVALLIGIGVLVVVALYMITVISRQRVEPRAEAAAEAPADVRSAAVIEEYEAIPIGARFAPTVDSFRTVIAARDGAEAHSAWSELVDFLIDIGRIDRAAIEQQRLARQTEQVDAWRRAGNLLYDWMESVNNERKTDVALLTIEAYEKVLQERPDDLDARAGLGWAYQYDPQNPMEAIEQTNRVLEEDPDHLAGNYNRGVFLLRINRVEDAVAQFERVAELAAEDSPYARQARAWIRTIQEQQTASP